MRQPSSHIKLYVPQTRMMILSFASCLLNTVEPEYYQVAKGLAKFIRYHKVSLYQGTLPHVLLLLRWRKSFVIPRTSVYKGSLYQGSTVTIFSPSDLNFLEQPVKIQQNKLYNSKVLMSTLTFFYGTMPLGDVLPLGLSEMIPCFLLHCCFKNPAYSFT